MTQIADIEVTRGNAKLAGGNLLLLGILLFLNHGVARVSDLLAFQMWPSDVDMAIFIVFGSAVPYVVLMALPFMPGIEIGRMLVAMLGFGGIVLVYLCTVVAVPRPMDDPEPALGLIPSGSGSHSGIFRAP